MPPEEAIKKSGRKKLLKKRRIQSVAPL